MNQGKSLQIITKFIDIVFLQAIQKYKYMNNSRTQIIVSISQLQKPLNTPGTPPPPAPLFTRESIPLIPKKLPVQINEFKFLQCQFLQNYKTIVVMLDTPKREKKLQWSTQESNLLKQYYPKFSSIKWKKIGQILRKSGYERTEEQIRERWNNFEDPSLLFTDWTEEELNTLYESYIKFGSKWCLIKKNIPGRTENKIKNKFYGNIRIFLRFVVNYFDSSKRDTMWIQNMSPSFLNQLYEGSGQFQEFENQMQVTIKKMGYNVDKIKLLSRIKSKSRIYSNFFEKINFLYKNYRVKKQSTAQTGNIQIQIKQQDQMIQLNQVPNQYNQEKITPEKTQKQQEPEITPINHSQLPLLSTQAGNYWPISSSCGSFNSLLYPLVHMQSTYPFFNYWSHQN